MKYRVVTNDRLLPRRKQVKIICNAIPHLRVWGNLLTVKGSQGVYPEVQELLATDSPQCFEIPASSFAAS